MGGRGPTMPPSASAHTGCRTARAERFAAWPPGPGPSRSTTTPRSHSAASDSAASTAPPHGFATPRRREEAPRRSARLPRHLLVAVDEGALSDRAGERHGAGLELPVLVGLDLDGALAQ